MASAVTVLGAGSWGTALAIHLARVGHDVSLWARDPKIIDTLTRAGENPVYLPGVALPANVKPLLLYEDKSPRHAVIDLMTRGLRRETD